MFPAGVGGVYFGPMSSSDSPTREQFVDQVIDQVRTKFPLVKVSRGSTAFSLSINGHVASLENLYRIAVLRPDESKRHIERWVVELIRAGEGTPDESANYDEIKDRILPMVMGPGSADVQAASVVSEPLVGGLRIAYAIDHDRTISYLPKAVFESWKISLEDLHEQALANLSARSEAINAHAAQDEDGRVYLILFQTMDGYDASRVLLPNLHEKLKGFLGSPFAAGVPNRDILLCFRNDEETVSKLQGQIEKDFRSMPHQVTDRLLLITADGIAPRPRE